MWPAAEKGHGGVVSLSFCLHKNCDDLLRPVFFAPTDRRLVFDWLRLAARKPARRRRREKEDGEKGEIDIQSSYALESTQSNPRSSVRPFGRRSLRV